MLEKSNIRFPHLTNIFNVKLKPSKVWLTNPTKDDFIKWMLWSILLNVFCRSIKIAPISKSLPKAWNTLSLRKNTGISRVFFSDTRFVTLKDIIQTYEWICWSHEQLLQRFFKLNVLAILVYYWTGHILNLS